MIALRDALAERGIRNLRSYDLGAEDNVDCPFCGAKGEKSLCVTIKRSEDGHLGAVWFCRRLNHCTVRSGAVYLRPEREAKPKSDDLAFWDYFTQRHIGKRTLDDFGVRATRLTFRKVGESLAIAYPYALNGMRLGCKYRAVPVKDFSQTPKMPQVLFNGDRIDPASPLYFTEGEADALAIYEAGYRNVVSLKDGALAFTALEPYAEILSKVPMFVLVGDSDEAGSKWADGLAIRLDPHKCRFVSLPADCKDAGEVMRRHGVTTLIEAIDAAQPRPMEGIRELAPGALALHKRTPRPPIWTTGTQATNDILKIPTDGRLIVTTGVPGHGKTTWTRFIAVHTALTYGAKWLIFAAEDTMSDYWDTCAEIAANRPFQDIPDAELDTINARLGQHIRLIVTDSDRNPPTPEMIIQYARYSVLQHGTNNLLVDPWTELEHARGSVPEHEYIGRNIQIIRAFGRQRQCNIWLNAHPTKMAFEERARPPEGYSISGTANWANKPDIGLTVWRPGEAQRKKHPSVDAQVICWKMRDKRYGRVGTARLAFDQTTNRYFDPPPSADDEPAPSWEREAVS